MHFITKQMSKKGLQKWLKMNHMNIPKEEVVHVWINALIKLRNTFILKF